MPRKISVVSVDLPDHIVSSFEARIAFTFHDLNHGDRARVLRMLCEAWTEGAIAERMRAE